LKDDGGIEMTTHGQNGYTVKYLECKYCEKKYEKGFFGSGFKYCSRVCVDKARRKYYKDRYVPTNKDCVICRRNIKTVGERKYATKYCSKKCMLLGQGVRANGQTMMKIEIPIKYYYKIFQEKKDVS